MRGEGVMVWGGRGDKNRGAKGEIWGRGGRGNPTSPGAAGGTAAIR